MATLQQRIGFAGPVISAGLRALARRMSMALMCAGGLWATGASAGAYAPRDVGGWTVAASRDGKGCFLTREFERTGGTTLLLGLDADGTNRLSLLNPDWSIRPKDRLKLNFRLSNSSYPAHFAVGIASAGKQGFVTSFGVKFPAYFAASAILEVSRGDVPVERLGLDGSNAAVVELRKCVAGQRQEPEAAAVGQERVDHIPKDPFAPAATRRRPRK